MHSSLFTLLPFLALISASPITKRQTNLGSLIVSGRSSSQCLSVQGGAQAVAAGQITNGTPVVTVPCGNASLWDISTGSGSVIVSGTAFALDIGLTPGNNGALKVWKSFPTSPQQTWYLTGDNRIAQTGGDQCLDQGDNGPQTYACTPGNTNQIWNVALDAPGPSVITSSSGPAPTVSSGCYAGPANGTLIISSHGPFTTGNASTVIAASGSFTAVTSATGSLVFSSSSPIATAVASPAVNSSGPLTTAAGSLVISSNGPAATAVIVTTTAA